MTRFGTKVHAVLSSGDRSAIRATMILAVVLVPAPALAGGPLLIDHMVTYDDSGIWDRKYQQALAVGAAVTVVGGAFFVDSDSRMGRTFDQTMDSIVLTAVTTTAMKYVFSRERPRENSDPGDFFDGAPHQSFPSGEVAEISAVVTPFIIEYHHDHPSVYLLALLPAYDAVARVKVHAHWQSDVLVGAAVGVGFGFYAHGRQTPLIMGLLPDGSGPMVTYSKKF
ncbi:phosphatase PAP2 family protein [Lysobacter sp. TAF61]|uniref:phosphatase PAP2 family protein n=1 Tax=Lysobacter sp. TAF61 TaxID=3233072 RepID=UPI003F94B24E